jgi:NAD(P)H-dependent flavin oxidoreductase YrpB (nitropropane dioxygenase family)
MRTRFIRSSEIEEAQIQVVLEPSVNIFTCNIGAPRELLGRAKALGKTTLAMIGSPHHVQRAAAAGVDMLIAQGYYAGAHTGLIGTYFFDAANC